MTEQPAEEKAEGHEEEQADGAAEPEAAAEESHDNGE